MKKLLIFCMLLTFCLAAPAAHAVKVNMNTATCADIEDATDLQTLVIWMDGYMSAKSGDMMLDSATVEQNAQHIVDTCSKNNKYKLVNFLKQ